MRTVRLTRPGGIATLVVVLTVLVFSAGTAVGQTANTKGSTLLMMFRRGIGRMRRSVGRSTVGSPRGWGRVVLIWRAL